VNYHQDRDVVAAILQWQTSAVNGKQAFEMCAVLKGMQVGKIFKASA
jgi:hypothetical protein